MHFCISRPFPRAAVSPALLTLSAVLAPSAPAAQGSFLVSPSSSVPASGGLPEVDDASLALVDGSGTAQLALSAGHWLATSGRVPGDVDGLARRPGVDPGHHGSLVFTLLSNEAGYLDGDVIGFAAGGDWEVVVSEDTVATALGTPGAAIDLDALAYDESGRLAFSLQADLSGTVLGPVEDGDVLRLEPDGTATRVASEADVQAAFTAATGLSGAVGDVLAATWVEGELWVATQGPSSHDGGLLALGPVPSIVYEEATLGLGGDELNAVTAADPGDAGRVWMSQEVALPGETLTATYTGGEPFGLLALFPAGDVGYAAADVAQGFGAWYFDLADPTLNLVLAGGVPIFALDGSGRLDTTWHVPTGVTAGAGFGGETGWTFQCVDLASQTVTAPYRVEVP